jgi:hypothetical protein
MNNTIKQLAEEAGLGRDRWNSTDQFNDFLEDFAGKIVRECIDVCMKNQFKGESIHNNGAVSSAELIKEHFGVE